MDIDQRIKHELDKDAADIDRILAEDKGMFVMMARAFKGNMRVWVTLITIASFAVTGLMIWCGYRFFHAPAIDSQLFWGVAFLTTFITLAFYKFWFFMEVNRGSIMRELKRLELEVARLSEQTTK